MFHSLLIIIPLLLNTALIRRKCGRGQGNVRSNNVLSITGGELDINLQVGKSNGKIITNLREGERKYRK
jgi:hypothetical protein